LGFGRRILGGSLAIVGGLLILSSGFRTHSFILQFAPYLEQQVNSSIPYAAQVTISAGISVLSFIIALGGLAVITGAIFVFLNHLTLGKLLIALGGGFGLIGILIAVGYAVFTSGPAILITEIDYWIGIVIASVGRYVAK
jgi:hypothetical protein